MKKARKYPQKLFLSYSAFFLTVLLLIFVVTLTITYREQYHKVLDSQLQLVSKTEDQVNESLQSMDRIVNGLLFNQSFMTIIKDKQVDLHYTDNSKQVLNTFVSLDAPLFPTHRIIAFNDSIYYNFSKTGENPEYIRQAMEIHRWKQQILSSDGEKVIIPMHQDSFDAAPYKVYSVARAITDGKQRYGVIEVQNSYDYLEQICSLDAHVGQVALFSSSGEQIYPNTKEDFLSNLNRQVEQAGGQATGSFQYEKQLVCYSISPYSGWITYIYRPVSEIIPFTLPLVAAFLIAFILLAAGTMVIIRIITNRLTSPLIALNQALKKVSIDNLSLELPTQYGVEEIESINQSFLTMFSQLKESIARNVQARANEERANYLALQSQMNPHTLYNTIGMIESVSYINGDKEVSNLCICFSDMLRYISDYSKKTYTIRDELQHLNNYAVLIETRYKGKLEIYTDFDETLLDKQIPKFTIQPLVENSVKHGFGGPCGHLIIQVTVSACRNGWAIRILDNGQGFTEQRLAEIEQQFLHCDECLKDSNDVLNRKIGNLALSNIYIRLRILYGKSFQFTLANRQDGLGACIELVIQEEKKEEP